MARNLRPREPIAPAPTHVSQLTSLPIAGIDSRRYLELLIEHPEVPRACVGRLRVVSIDDLRALLARIASTSAPETTPAGLGDDDQLRSADDALRALGMRRAS
jgi:hypothetical protein